ncbi:MAG: hypothetical protein QXY39_06020 [Thermofilaceae archaeon]
MAGRLTVLDLRSGRTFRVSLKGAERFDLNEEPWVCDRLYRVKTRHGSLWIYYGDAGHDWIGPGRPWGRVALLVSPERAAWLLAHAGYPVPDELLPDPTDPGDSGPMGTVVNVFDRGVVVFRLSLLRDPVVEDANRMFRLYCVRRREGWVWVEVDMRDAVGFVVDSAWAEKRIKSWRCVPVQEGSD